MDPAVVATLRAGLALLFGVAAAHKLRDLPRFRESLADYRLLPLALVPLAAALLVGSEAAVTVALVAPPLGSAGLVAAAGLLLLYAAAIGINLARGRRHIDCGCAGPAVSRPLSAWLVARNAVLAALALAGLAPLHVRPLLWVDGLTIAGATAALAALYTALDRMLADAPLLARVRGEA
jgi:hypothetical protein